MSRDSQTTASSDQVLMLYDRISCIIQELYRKFDLASSSDWTIFDHEHHILHLQCLQEQVTTLLSILTAPPELPYRYAQSEFSVL